MKTYYVYMLSDKSRKVLYTGFCNDLNRRLQEHIGQKGSPFTFAGRYHCTILLYYEVFHEVSQAIAREKQIKRWRRSKKEFLINKMNPKWKDLKDGLLGDLMNG